MREFLYLSWQIVRRNWLVYSKDFWANISPTFTEPGFLLLALGAGLGPFVERVHGHSYLQFLAPGVAVSSAMFTAFFETSYGFYVRLTFEAIFKAMLTTPIGAREVVAGELMWVFLKGAMMTAGVSLVLACFGLFSFVAWLPVVPLIGGLVALPCGAIGLIASGTVRNINQFQAVYAFIISPLYFFSGIFFPVDAAPGWFQVFVNISPLYHGARLAQMAFWNEFHVVPALGHLAVLLGYAVVLIAVANRLVQRKLVL